MNSETISIEELAEDIEMLIWEQGISCFKITEDLKRGKSSYLLRDLHIEVEDDIVYSWDSDDIIFSNMYQLMNFLKNYIIYINRIVVDEVPYGIVKLKTGKIIIEILE